jgi:hypothetical protein
VWRRTSSISRIILITGFSVTRGLTRTHLPRYSRTDCSSTATREVPRSLWNLEVRYLVHNSPPFVPVTLLTCSEQTAPCPWKFVTLFTTARHLYLEPCWSVQNRPPLVPESSLPCSQQPALCPCNPVNVFRTDRPLSLKVRYLVHNSPPFVPVTLLTCSEQTGSCPWEFVTLFTKARPLSMTGERSIQSTVSQPIPWRPILVLSSYPSLCIPSELLLSLSLCNTKTPHTSLLPHQSHISWCHTFLLYFVTLKILINTNHEALCWLRHRQHRRRTHAHIHTQTIVPLYQTYLMDLIQLGGR